MAMKITQVIRSGMAYMNHLVSHTALPEAGASKHLPLQAKEQGYYSLAGLTAVVGKHIISWQSLGEGARFSSPLAQYPYCASV